MLFLLAFTCRVAYILKAQTFNDGADEIERAAASFAREGVIGNIFMGSPGKSAFAAPLYPTFLGCIYFVFGWDTLAGRVAQGLFAIFAASLGIVLLPLIARKVQLPMKSGWIAGIIMAVLPLNLWVETSGKFEYPYAPLMLLSLLWVFHVLHDERWTHRRIVLLAGFLLGLAALLSPAFLPVGFLMLIAELWSQEGRRKQILKEGLLLLAVFLVVVTPWIIRNYYALGGFVPIRSNFGLELLTGNNPQATGKSYTTSWNDLDSPTYRLHPNSNDKERARLAQLGELAYMREKQQTGLKWIKENPGRFVDLTLHRFRLFWFPPPDEWAPSSSARLFKSLLFCLIGVGMFCELFRLGALRHSTRWLLAAAVFGPTITYMITHVDPKFRYPIFGMSTLLACNFAFAAWRFAFQRQASSDRNL